MKQPIILAAIVVAGVVALWACAQIWGLRLATVGAMVGAAAGVVAALYLPMRWRRAVAQPDPDVLMRNTATLQAWRARHKAARAYAQPYMAVGIGGLALAVVVLVVVLFTPRLRHMVWLESLILIPAQLVLIVSYIRIGVYLNRHPFDPDKIEPSRNRGGPAP